MEANQLKRDTIISLKEYLPKLEAGVNTCIDLFRANDEVAGVRYLPYIVEGLNWCIESISLTGGANLHNIPMDQIPDLLQEMITSIENKDYVLLADMLEYEVLPLIESWEKDLLQQ